MRMQITPESLRTLERLSKLEAQSKQYWQARREGSMPMYSLDQAEFYSMLIAALERMAAHTHIDQQSGE